MRKDVAYDGTFQMIIPFVLFQLTAYGLPFQHEFFLYSLPQGHSQQVSGKLGSFSC